MTGGIFARICPPDLDNQQVVWFIHGVSEEIGIFEAKTKLSELCSKVAETGREYVITRRGRPVARIVAPSLPVRAEEAGLLSRMEKTTREFGAIAAEEPDFPAVWEDRWGCKPSPFDADDNRVPISEE